MFAWSHTICKYSLTFCQQLRISLLSKLALAKSLPKMTVEDNHLTKLNTPRQNRSKRTLKMTMEKVLLKTRLFSRLLLVQTSSRRQHSESLLTFLSCQEMLEAFREPWLCSLEQLGLSSLQGCLHKIQPTSSS